MSNSDASVQLAKAKASAAQEADKEFGEVEEPTP